MEPKKIISIIAALVLLFVGIPLLVGAMRKPPAPPPVEAPPTPKVHEPCPIIVTFTDGTQARVLDAHTSNVDMELVKFLDADRTIVAQFPTARVKGFGAEGFYENPITAAIQPTEPTQPTQE